MTPTEAINIIARHALADAAWTIEDAWENYPDIGESAWEMVVHTANTMRMFPPGKEYDEAYALLKSLAEHDAV